MTRPDFDALAREAAGARWDSMNASERELAREDAAEAWVGDRLGPELPEGPGPGFGAWIRGQPPAVQDSVLGARRGASLRAGRIAVDRFADRPGTELTLEELRATKPELE